MYSLNIGRVILARMKPPGLRPMIRYRTDWPEPQVRHPNEVKVRTMLGGICATDLHQIKVDISYAASIFANPITPFPMGHEFLARVEETGSQVTSFASGDRVVFNPIPSCDAYGFEKCGGCRAGNYQSCLCLAGVGDGSAAEACYGGRGGFGGEGGGGFCEKALGFEKQFYKVPDTISDEVAVLAEPFAVAIHGVARNLPKNGQTVAVFGAGIIGLMIIAAIRALGPSCRIITLARYPFQAEAARRLGSDEVIVEGDRKRLYEVIAKMTGGTLLKPTLGKKLVFGASDLQLIFDGVASEASVDDALHLVSSNGKIVLVGLGYSTTKKVDWSLQVWKEIGITGTLGYGIEFFEHEHVHAFDVALRLMASNPKPFEGLLTHTFPIEKYRTALACAEHKGRNHATKVAFAFER